MELLEIAETMRQWEARGRGEEIWRPLEQLKEVAEEVGRAWSGSWLGYQALVYYRNFQPVPAGRHFSQYSGIRQSPYGDSYTVGDWVEFNEENAIQEIYSRAGISGLEVALEYNRKALRGFQIHKLSVLSILETESSNSDGDFLVNLKKEIDEMSVLTERDVIRVLETYAASKNRRFQGFRERDPYSPTHLRYCAGPCYTTYDCACYSTLTIYGAGCSPHFQSWASTTREWKNWNERLHRSW